MFEVGFSELSVMGPDLTHQLLTERQNPIDFGRISAVLGSFRFQMLEAVLDTLQSVIGLRTHQTQSLTVPSRKGGVHFKDLTKPGTLIAAHAAPPGEMPELKHQCMQIHHCASIEETDNCGVSQDPLKRSELVLFAHVIARPKHDREILDHRFDRCWNKVFNDRSPKAGLFRHNVKRSQSRIRHAIANKEIEERIGKNSGCMWKIDNKLVIELAIQGKA